MYLRHDDGDTGFRSHNPAFEGADPASGRFAFVSRFDGELVAVIEYRLSNGQEDQYPASWALPEQEIMRPQNISLRIRAVAHHLCIGTTMPANNVASSIYVRPAMP